LDPPLGLQYDLMLIVEAERSDGTGGHTGWFHIVEQRSSVVAHVTFSGDPFFKIEPGYFVRTGLKAVAATDALLFIDDNRAPVQLGNGPNRADPGTGRLYAMLTSPVVISLTHAVFVVDEQIDHHPVVSCEIDLTVGGQFIPVHF
jgi:hypothetical protein